MSNKCEWIGIKESPWISKNGNKFICIEIGLESCSVGNNRLTWPIALSHEIAHLLLAKTIDMSRYMHEYRYKFRQEVLAWRLAKSFIKSKYWNESLAISILRSFHWSKNVNMKKLKIIEMNAGIRLGIKEGSSSNGVA